jgi:hypothetical protein
MKVEREPIGARGHVVARFALVLALVAWAMADVPARAAGQAGLPGWSGRQSPPADAFDLAHISATKGHGLDAAGKGKGDWLPRLAKPLRGSSNRSGSALDRRAEGFGIGGDVPVRGWARFDRNQVRLGLTTRF